MSIYFHEEDLPEGVAFADGPIAVDTEAMGLIPGRDRLCLVQLSDGRGDEHLIRFSTGSDYSAPRLKALLSDPARLKLYHFARFDLGIISKYLGIVAAPVEEAPKRPRGAKPKAAAKSKSTGRASAAKSVKKKTSGGRPKKAAAKD